MDCLHCIIRTRKIHSYLHNVSSALSKIRARTHRREKASIRHSLSITSTIELHVFVLLMKTHGDKVPVFLISYIFMVLRVLSHECVLLASRQLSTLRMNFCQLLCLCCVIVRLFQTNQSPRQSRKPSNDLLNSLLTFFTLLPYKASIHRTKHR